MRAVSPGIAPGVLYARVEAPEGAILAAHRIDEAEADGIPDFLLAKRWLDDHPTCQAVWIRVYDGDTGQLATTCTVYRDTVEITTTLRL